jgi:hypothetical protein
MDRVAGRLHEALERATNRGVVVDDDGDGRA